MLDRHSGVFLLDDGTRIGPTTTREEFLREPLGARAERGQSWEAQGQRWSSYVLHDCISERFAWRLHLKFRDERLFTIDLCPQEDDGKGWESWSYEAEMGKVRAYDAVAERWVGPAPRKFAWGWVSTAFDPRGGGGYFTIRYEIQSE